MHVLLLTAYFPPDVGSASHLFYELGQTLVTRDHQVSVVTGFPSYHAQGNLESYRGRLWLRERMGGMEVYRLAVPEVARNTPAGRGLWQFSCALTLALAGLRVPRPDVCLVYSPPLSLGLSALAWRVLRGVPCVLNVQDLFPQSAIDLGVLRQKTLIRFFEWLERWTYRRADAVTVHSKGNQEHVLALGGNAATTFVVHNAVDTEHICPGPREGRLRTDLSLDGAFVVSFAGVMGHSQNLDVILGAASDLQAYDKIQFLLVGDGVEKNRLVHLSERMALANVTWLPMQPREAYPRILQASDVGLATLHANVKTPVVPSKILSVMASGRPVIAAMDPAGDAPRLINEAEAGFSLGAEDPKALAAAILQLYEDPALCQRLGENGRRYAVDHFSTQAVTDRYEQVFDAIRMGQVDKRCPLNLDQSPEGSEGHCD
jgi:glycosyltransferase involved in cell wall biosynthesis